MDVEARIKDLGLALPALPLMPPSTVTAFSWVRVAGLRVLVSGHGSQNQDGSPATPFGRVPDTVSLKPPRLSARGAALAVLSSLRGAIGDLDRIQAWLSVTGYVNCEPGYTRTTAVLNSFSDVILQVFGTEVGAHARTAIGVSALPLDLPVVVAAEVAISA